MSPIGLSEGLPSLEEWELSTGEHISLGQIAAIPVPITCLLGELSPPALANATRRIVAACPGVPLIMRPGAGHAIPFDRPAELANAVQEAAKSPQPVGR